MNRLRFILVISVVVLTCTSAFGQIRRNAAPYDYAIGGTVGFYDGVSFKTFPVNNFAIQVDLGYRFLYDYMHNDCPLILTISPSFMYEKAIQNGFYWFVGGGLDIGGSYYYNYNRHGFFAFGVHGIGGAEYKFANIPLTLQADVRPGFFLFANNRDRGHAIFDYNFFNFSVRYTF